MNYKTIEYRLIKISLISSVSYLIWGFEALFRGLSPQKFPCGDGTEFRTPVTAWAPQLGDMEGG